VYSNCLQEGVALAEEVSRGQAKHGTPTAPLQQETPGRDTNTLPVCPFKFQSMVVFSCSAVSFVLCCAMLCYAMSCHAMLCYAMLCHSQLVGIDTVHMQHLHKDCALCVQDEHGMQQECQDFQQELQDIKTALHLSKDRLQKADATIDCLRSEAEVCLLV